MPKISIIVPVYNIECYIEKCILSIQNQTFTDFECIIINDGSSDRTVDIIKPLVESDDRFHIVHHDTNIGQGNARNTGLNLAHGEYLTFIDGDDYVEPEYLEQFFEVIQRTQAVVVTSNYFGEQNSKRINISNNCHHTIIVNFLSGAIILGVANKMYKKSLFDNYSFPPRTYEDICANIILAVKYKIAKIPQVQKPLYHYEYREGSTTKSCNAQQIDDFVEYVLKIPIGELSKEEYKLEYFHKYLCVYVFAHMVHILRIIWKYSPSPQTQLDNLRTKIQGRIPNFRLRFFQLRDFCLIASVYNYNMSCSIFVLFPILRMYFKGSNLALFTYSFIYKVHQTIAGLKKNL